MIFAKKIEEGHSFFRYLEGLRFLERKFDTS